MGVMIEGMEMPKRCAKCPCCINQKDNDYGSFGECTLQNWKKVDCLVWSIDIDCPLKERVICKTCKHKKWFASDGQGNDTYCCNVHMRNIISDDYYCAYAESEE